MDASCSFSRRIQASNDAITSTQRLGVVVDAHTTHAVVDHWCDDRNMEGVAGLKRQIVEELLSPFIPRLAAAVGLIWTVVRILLLLLGQPIVFLECFFNVFQRDSILLCEFAHVVVRFHDTTALVVLAMPSDLFRGFPVQTQEEAGSAS